MQYGHGATALAVITGSAGALGPYRKLAGVGCAESPSMRKGKRKGKKGKDKWKGNRKGNICIT